MEQHMTHEGQMSLKTVRKNYAVLGISFVVMLVLMYLIMFAMIYSLGEFIQNINFFYMAVMMATPMTAMMPLIMPSMYPNRSLNVVVYAGSVLLFIFAFAAIRTQALVGDSEFLRSMIPHHSGAILMCEQAHLADSQVKALCDEIVRSQATEIQEMEAIRLRLSHQPGG